MKLQAQLGEFTASRPILKEWLKKVLFSEKKRKAKRKKKILEHHKRRKTMEKAKAWGNAVHFPFLEFLKLSES